MCDDINLTVNPSTPTPDLGWAGLRVQLGFQAVSGCTNSSQLIVTAEPAGSSHLIPVITPPAWPCLYLKVWEKALM